MKQLLLICLTLLLLACSRDKVGPQYLHPSQTGELAGRQVFIVDEGNFGRGNASITAYTPADNRVIPRLFSAYNDGRPLGDVAQHMQAYEGRYFLVLNNSGIVVVVNSENWQEVGKLSDMQYPRYIAFAGKRAFVTELYARKLYVHDLQSLKLDTVLPMPGNTAHIIQWNEKIWVGAERNLVCVDPSSLAIDSVYILGRGVAEMVVDHEDNLWVLSTGDAAFHQIDRAGNLLKQWTWPGGSSPRLLTVNPAKDSLYFVVDKSIYRQAVEATDLSPQKLWDFPGQTIYGFAVDPHNGDIYIADALDYDQASDIYRYARSGQLKHIFKAGIISNGFYFEE